MYNYRLKKINERDTQVFLETSYYWGPGLPIFASKQSIKNEIDEYQPGKVDELINLGLIELYWIDEKLNIEILSKLLSSDDEALFLPENYRKQVINAKHRKQPCYFFVEKDIRKNYQGNPEIRLRQSCEAMPHKKGYKYGFNLEIVLGTELHKVQLDGNLRVINIEINENKLLPNEIFC